MAGVSGRMVLVLALALARIGRVCWCVSGGHQDHPAQGSNESSWGIHVVETNSGPLRGRVRTLPDGSKVWLFFGVPYAEPPTGDNRFRAPIPVKPWSDIREVSEFGPMCIQPPEQKIWDAVRARGKSVVRKRKLENYVMTEDCLTMNIYVPLRQDELTQVPVLFYIHGGSFYMNGGRLYPGEKLAAMGIIVITFNYRLGPFGFLSTADRASPGNYGLLDQVMALQWVQDNIRNFGGDPEKVVIFGNSAGGASVMFHVLSPLSRGLFVAAIAQSGCSGAPWAIQKNPRKHAKDLAIALRCPTDPTPDMLDCIRTFSADLIMKKANLEDGLGVAFAAVIDGPYGGRFLPESPESLLSKGQFNQVPFIAGVTKDEVSIWFTKFGPTLDVKVMQMFLEKDVEQLLRNVAIPDVNVAAVTHAVKVQYLYRRSIKEDKTSGRSEMKGETNALSDFISDVGLKAPCIKELELLAAHNSKPSFFYEFTYFSVDDVKAGRQEWIGSYHESELQFFLGEPYLNYSNHLRAINDKAMSDISMKLWMNVAMFGHPTPNTSENPLPIIWEPYSNAHHSYLSLGMRSYMAENYLTERMVFWNSFYEIFRDYPLNYTRKLPCSRNHQDFEQTWMFWFLLVLSLVFSMVISLLFLKMALDRKKRRSRIPLSSPRGTTIRIEEE